MFTHFSTKDKKMRPFYFILLLIWFALAYFLCQSRLCHTEAPILSESITEPATDTTDLCIPALLFKDADFKVISKENFKFLNSQYNHFILSPEFEEKLKSVAIYLDENPNRKMKIKGLFLKNETNDTDYANLGLARAYNVKTYFLRLGVNSSQLLTSAKLANPECFEGDTLEKGIVVAFGE